MERKYWEAGGKNQKVPAQRLVDFIEGRKSKDLPNSSSHPGLTSADLNEILPNIIAKNLKAAFITFGEKMKGFLTNEAVLHAPES